MDLAAPEDRLPVGVAALQSVFAPGEMQRMAHEPGFKVTELISAARLTARYLANRSEGLRATSLQELLIAATQEVF